METIGNQDGRELERVGEGIPEVFEAKGSRGESGLNSNEHEAVRNLEAQKYVCSAMHGPYMYNTNFLFLASQIWSEVFPLGVLSPASTHIGIDWV
jgi:hypothetical protein